MSIEDWTDSATVSKTKGHAAEKEHQSAMNRGTNAMGSGGKRGKLKLVKKNDRVRENWCKQILGTNAQHSFSAHEGAMVKGFPKLTNVSTWSNLQVHHEDPSNDRRK